MRAGRRLTVSSRQFDLMSKWGGSGWFCVWLFFFDLRGVVLCWVIFVLFVVYVFGWCCSLVFDPALE